MQWLGYGGGDSSPRLHPLVERVDVSSITTKVSGIERTEEVMIRTSRHGR